MNEVLNIGNFTFNYFQMMNILNNWSQESSTFSFSIITLFDKPITNYYIKKMFVLFWVSWPKIWEYEVFSVGSDSYWLKCLVELKLSSREKVMRKLMIIAGTLKITNYWSGGAKYNTRLTTSLTPRVMELEAFQPCLLFDEFIH